LFHADRLVTQGPATAEPEAAPEDVSKSTSWTPSYSTTIQGSSPHFESEAASGDDSEHISPEPLALTRDAEPVPAPAEPVAAVELLESPVTGDAKPTDEARVDSKSELDETAATEAETETPPVEKVETTETPRIVTPVDEEPPEPAATETSWTRSYSVTSQPGSPRLSPKAELKELEPEPRPVESVQEIPVAASIVGFSDVPKTVVTPAVEGEDEDVAEPVLEEEPKPAWTRSYSVTSQPGSPRVSPKQVPEEIPEPEVKPSWTRSYSVTSQPGSPRAPPTEDLPEPIVEPTTVVIPPVEEATPASAESGAPERPKSPWTPSYSVTTLDGQAGQVLSKDAEPETEDVSIPKTLIGEAPEPNPETDTPITDIPTSEPLAVKDEQPEQPKLSWTPSYSVTTLPGSAPAEVPELDSIANKPSVGVEAAKVVEEHPEGNGTTSDVFEVHEAVAQLAVHDEPQVDAETTEPAALQLDPVSHTLLH